MTADPIPLEIVCKEGPVLIPSLDGRGLNATYQLWNNLTASESFPANTDSAFYILTLSKMVNHPGEVWNVEAELQAALQLLSRAWPFSGGSFFVIETYEVLKKDRRESNAPDVEKKLLSRDGHQSVSSTAMMNFETLSQYVQAPLATASQLAKEMHHQHALAKLLEYHQEAWVEYYFHNRTHRSAWFTDLYKVRDLLNKIYKHGHKARKELSISSKDWSDFGDILNNNDLRHSEVTGTAPEVARADVDRLFKLARCWIRKYIEKLGLPVCVP